VRAEVIELSLTQSRLFFPSVPALERGLPTVKERLERGNDSTVSGPQKLAQGDKVRIEATVVIRCDNKALLVRKFFLSSVAWPPSIREKGTLERASAISSSASAAVGVTGFSRTTCLPASSAAYQKKKISITFRHSAFPVDIHLGKLKVSVIRRRYYNEIDVSVGQKVCQSLVDADPWTEKVAPFRVLCSRSSLEDSIDCE
jgi:hypothetical protein